MMAFIVKETLITVLKLIKMTVHVSNVQVLNHMVISNSMQMDTICLVNLRIGQLWAYKKKVTTRIRIIINQPPK